MKRLLAILLFSGVAIGCAHSQVPPTTHSVALTWGATTSGGTGPYSYILSRYTMTSQDTSCPAPNTSNPNYTPLNSASPVSGTAYTDTTAAGLKVCFVVQAKDSAGAISQPSNTAGPYSVPTIPGTPVTLGGSVTASLDTPQPALPKPAEGSDAPVVAKLEGRIR